MLTKDAGPEMTEIADFLADLADKAIEKIPGIGFWYSLSKGVCEIATGNTSKGMKDVLKTAHAN